MSRQSNILQIWGNKDSMNMNSMILTNIQTSIYFKQTLFELKTYHEVIDEIYYRVKHLEPWEKGSRRTQGLTGMCGGVRGVGGGGIVSTAFCLLYKLYTLKLTRKQVMGLIEHKDSPYIRALGFMYVRYTQNPQDLFYWYSDYLDDEEELDVKAGGGMVITIGQMLRQWLLRLEWFDTLFPRIPIPIQNEITSLLRDRYGNRIDAEGNVAPARTKRISPPETHEEIEPSHRKKARSPSRSRSRTRSPERNHHGHSRRRSRSRSRSRSKSLKKKRSHRSRSHSPRKRRSRSRSKESRRHKSSKHHKRDRERARSGSSGESEPGEIRTERKERKRSRDRN